MNACNDKKCFICNAIESTSFFSHIFISKHKWQFGIDGEKKIIGEIFFLFSFMSQLWLGVFITNFTNNNNNKIRWSLSRLNTPVVASNCLEDSFGFMVWNKSNGSTYVYNFTCTPFLRFFFYHGINCSLHWNPTNKTTQNRMEEKNDDRWR